MKVKWATLENFRGVRNATYEFSDRTIIKGPNGSNKSTIASAILWPLVDRDITLVSNPPVRPNDAIDEVVTKVTLGLEISGKPVEVQKIQKLKRNKKTDSVALTNSYMVNSVPKTEKAFKEQMVELGFNFDKFLPCSHTGVLLDAVGSKKDRDKLRNTLFEMSGKYTDLDVCKDDPELEDLAALLLDYTAEEIEAIQNNVKRTTDRDYGKEGEILRAKIEGLEAVKVIVDDSRAAKVEALKNEYKEVQAQNEQKCSELKDLETAAARIMEINFMLSKLEADAIQESSTKKSSVEKDVLELGYRIATQQRQLEGLARDANAEAEIINTLKYKISTNKRTVADYQNAKFDDSTAICPTCGQKLPKNKVMDLKAEHENKIARLVAKGEETIKSQEKDLVMSIDNYDRLCQEIDKSKKYLAEITRRHADLENYLFEMGDIPKPDMSENEEYQSLLDEKSEAQKKLENEAVIRGEFLMLQEKLESIRSEIRVHEREMELAKQNDRIDEQIKKLRIDQANYEQQKADAEKILHQLKILNMKKNQLMQDSINSNFKMIKWKLFGYRKNGEPYDTCIPMIGDKTFGESMNYGLETLAKIDAMNGIQKFFKFDYPIILDNAEHLDSNSVSQIETEHQLFLFRVTDDEGLVIE